ncbi:MAG: sulfatase [Verrucomicrobiales bacterium]|nr:sulfatase [Verrucomicrobiales bacterium]|tara:strand:+ start:2347 stop:3792 length:1446 start_codon:yes stop_codon:yes gene_type:complete
MNTIDRINFLRSRRQFFGRAATGLGAAALASLLQRDAIAASGGMLSNFHVAPKAKRAIWLFMSGAPSQLDMWDYKPQMQERFDEDLPDSVRNGQRLTGMTARQKRFPVAPTKYEFHRHGQSGIHVSEVLPYTAKMIDDIAVVKSLNTEAINHDPAITYIQTGNQVPGLPCLGSWLSYGLGSTNENLPTFMVLNSTWSAKRDAQALYARLWGSGFLPSEHQGVALRSQGDPVLYLSNPPGVSGGLRRQMLNGVNAMNRRHFQRLGDPETEARISQYEMAFRMQSSVPELVDISNESDATLKMYGPDVTTPGTFAYNCLLARRMAEKNVRYTQIFHRGWDQHGNLTVDLPLQVGDIDQPCYALVQDLKQRGLLDDTLVIWAGEFGRTAYGQGRLTRENYGRDHHPRCFSGWLAGGGIKGGTTYGATDDYGYNVVENPVHIRDLNATILNQFGIDHERLSYRFQGLDQRLTGVEEARVIKDILA